MTNRRSAAANLIAGAYHTAGQYKWVGKSPWPYKDYLDQFEGNDEQKLLRRTAAAIEEGNQLTLKIPLTLAEGGKSVFVLGVDNSGEMSRWRRLATVP